MLVRHINALVMYRVRILQTQTKYVGSKEAIRHAEQF